MTSPASDLVYDWNSRRRRGALSPLSEGSLSFFDETLRDGIQSPSVRDPSLAEKQEILRLTASLGIDAVDLGLPGAGPRAVEDVTELIRFAERERLGIQYACAARTHERDINAVADIAQATGQPIMVYAFLGSSPIRLYTEDWDVQTLLKRTREAAELCQKREIEMCFVTEDTTRSNPEDVKMIYQRAMELGVRRLCVCDTCGHVTPNGVKKLLAFIDEEVIKDAGYQRRDIEVNWHGHQDRGLGVANNIAAVEAGADVIHGTALGVGERAGNAPLDQTLVNLKLMGVIDNDLTMLDTYMQKANEYIEVPLPRNYPVFGEDAFETGTGVHASAVIKAMRKGDHWLADRVYSGVPAGDFGLKQVIRIGHMSGRSNIVWWLEQNGIEASDDLVAHLFEVAKSQKRNMLDEEIHQAVATFAGQ